MRKKNLLILILSSAILGGLVGSLISYVIFAKRNPDVNELIRNFYLTENAVHVSPHAVRKKMDKGDTSFILVDLRSKQEYEQEHVIGAINIPAYIDPNTSISLETDK